MSGRWWRGAHRRPLRAQRPEAAQAPVTSERDAEAYPTPPELADLLDEMRRLRLTLALDLTAAAAATEQGADAVAADIVAADRRELSAFARRVTNRLTPIRAAQTDVEPVPARATTTDRRWRRRIVVSLPAVPLVGALAVSAAAAMGALPVPGHSSGRVIQPSTTAAAPVTTTFHQFVAVLNGDPSASQVISAADALHQQIAQLLATARQDPAHVNEVATLLQMEQALLMRKQPPGSNVVLAASRQLAAKLLKLAPLSSPSSQSTPHSMTTSQPSHHNTAPTPTPTATSSKAAPAPTATPTTRTSPSSSSSPSSYPTKLPDIGN